MGEAVLHCGHCPGQLGQMSGHVQAPGATRGGCLKTLLTGKIDGEVVEQER